MNGQLGIYLRHQQLVEVFIAVTSSLLCAEAEELRNA
jgi:hypothetical protein